MAKIAFILLCHKDPEAVIKQAERLTAAGDYMAIHFDASASPAHFEEIRTKLKGNPNVAFAKKRIKCGWGAWSLVQATLNAVEAAEAAFPRATHFYMLSGDCMPIKPAVYAHDFLDRDDMDYIESFDYFESDWIKTGMKEERLIYRHYFNERTQKWLFYTSFDLQRKFGLAREIPADVQIQIGSQWWCLRRQTIEGILRFVKERKDVMRFFKTTWIPDETFFQTVVRHIIPEIEIESRTLTFLMFSEYGMPVTFYNDHYEMLLSQDFLFARKISPEAVELKRRLGALYASDDAEIQISNEGQSLFKFLTGRGREGRRFTPRFWEAEAGIGRDRELMIVACKKWHVAKRLLEGIGGVSDIPVIQYLFNEEGTPLPDLGGIQATIGKRTRHRRALIRMLFDFYKTDRMVICLDTSNLDLMQDFNADRARTKILEIECNFTSDFLIGHAKRIGLAGEAVSAETMRTLMPTIRQDLVFEADAVRDAEFPGYLCIRESNSSAENAKVLAEFLDIPTEDALKVASIHHLFSD